MTIDIRRFTLVSATLMALVLPGCRTAEGTCERVAEVTEKDGKKIHKVACLMHWHELKGDDRDKLLDCLSDASDAAAMRTCFQ